VAAVADPSCVRGAEVPVGKAANTFVTDGIEAAVAQPRNAA
jgi:hypothetical protein